MATEEWREVLLEDLAAPQRNALVGGPFGSDLVSSDYTPTGVPVVRGENVSVGRWVAGDFVFVAPSKAKRLEANTAGPLDIVFTQRGANHFRQVAVVRNDAPQRFLISQSQMKLTVDPQKADPLYIYYAFRAPPQQTYLQRNAIQTGVPHTNLSILRKTPLRIPSVPVQRAIAGFLGALDDKIELDRRTAKTLEAMARALFRSWFVDFDPVRDKAEGRPTGLSDDLAALFPNRFGEDGLPRGWGNTVVSIGRLSRSTVQPEDVTAETPYIGLEHLERRHLVVERWGHAEDVNSTKTTFNKGDLLFGKLRPYFHKVAIAPTSGICSSDIFVFRPSNGVPSSFLYLTFSEELFVETASNASSGTRMPRADWNYMAEQSAVLPPPEILNAFDAIITPMIVAMQARAEQSRTLASLRDTLLPKLISGELRITDAEKRISAA